MEIGFPDILRYYYDWVRNLNRCQRSHYQTHHVCCKL